MTRWVAYLRRSLKEKEKQRISIEVQRKVIKETAKNYGIEIDLFLPPERRTGLDSNRPIFNKMIELVREGKYDGIVAYSVDRLSRNLQDSGKILDLLLDRDPIRSKNSQKPVQLFIAKSPDTDWRSFEGVMQFLMYSWFGVFEVLTTQMRTSTALKYLREEGRHTGATPFGYRKIWRSKKKKDYIIEIKDEEAKIVRRIFELARDEGWGRRKIATELNLPEGLVRSILNNERYTGYAVVGNKIVDTELPPIIDLDLFCAVHPDHILCTFQEE